VTSLGGVRTSKSGPSQAAARPQNAEQARETTGIHEASNGHVRDDLDAFALVSGLCLGALIIRRSMVRVHPAPPHLRTSEAMFEDQTSCCRRFRPQPGRRTMSTDEAEHPIVGTRDPRSSSPMDHATGANDESGPTVRSQPLQPLPGTLPLGHTMRKVLRGVKQARPGRPGA
jgi:hypothetical protein